MTSTTTLHRSGALLVMAGAMLLAPLARASTALSPAQEKVISQKTAKLSKTERDMIAGWSDGKKLAEFFCSPAALAEFKKSLKGADRVFLGPDDEGASRFILYGNSKLSGRGTVRTPGNWKSYAFECVLDPDHAKVKAFTYKLEAQ